MQLALRAPCAAAGRRQGGLARGKHPVIFEWAAGRVRVRTRPAGVLVAAADGLRSSSSMACTPSHRRRLAGGPRPRRRRRRRRQPAQKAALPIVVCSWFGAARERQVARRAPRTKRTPHPRGPRRPHRPQRTARRATNAPPRPAGRLHRAPRPRWSHCRARCRLPGSKRAANGRPTAPPADPLRTTPGLRACGVEPPRPSRGRAGAPAARWSARCSGSGPGSRWPPGSASPRRGRPHEGPASQSPAAAPWRPDRPLAGAMRGRTAPPAGR
jgi:hypothetical protein